MKDLILGESYFNSIYTYWMVWVFFGLFSYFIVVFSRDLDENLQKSFHKFLEIRGIKPSTTNFLHEYMINKDSREYVAWLENLQKFVEA